MKIYIVDDNINIIKILERIIEDTDLGQVVGVQTNSTKAVEEILVIKPDIVLVDLLMPNKDGISLVRDLKNHDQDIQYIMISQVSSKDMIAKAYKSGIEYYISKPIDAIEVQVVIKKVIEKIEMNEKLVKIQSLFSSTGNIVHNEETNKKDKLEGIKRVMQRIGIMGESGSKDILDVAEYLIDNHDDISNYTVKDLCSNFKDNPKTKEQRIRRTATVGLVNLSNLGIEDYMNETFVEFSNGLYNFDQVKLEMDYIRGKGSKRGTVNIKKFIEGLIYYGTQN
ncbi:MAG: response regulator [Tissierellia bacterium]|nr:response regulator [Tissierellia bacterium]